MPTIDGTPFCLLMTLIRPSHTKLRATLLAKAWFGQGSEPREEQSLTLPWARLCRKVSSQRLDTPELLPLLPGRASSVFSGGWFEQKSELREEPPSSGEASTLSSIEPLEVA